ncbi:MAG: hypothetical protein J0M29_19200 [Chitinophagales bacterium]|nr:hypothetical protein [Chitinophagales bacterium]
MKHLQSILLLILLALAGGHTVSFGQTALASAGGESGAQANASATISDAERQNQVQLNHAFAHEFVLTYDHIPDHLEYTNDNYNKPVAERTIDNEDITPLTWKWVKLEMPEPGGSVMTACLRRPEWWLTAHQADVPGNWVAISLPEMGIHGKAQVKELAPSYVDTRFADFQTDDGQKYRPITGWFERRAPEVWQYVFTSGDTIGATPNHPFYSEDRQTYLPADALQTGERVKLASRQTAALLSKWKLETSSEVVYNLEVWRDHNFYVGEHGVLVHNSCLVGEIIEETAYWFKYKNLKGKILKIDKQYPAGIENAISTAENLEDNLANAGKRLEANVARAVQQKGKEVKGYGVKVKKDNGSPAGDMDILTEDEFIEVKKGLNDITDVNQFDKYTNLQDDNFMNLNARTVILYIGDAATDPDHPILQAIRAKSNSRIEIKIIIGSLEELKNALK